MSERERERGGEREIDRQPDRQTDRLQKHIFTIVNGLIAFLTDYIADFKVFVSKK